jgi:polyisoprenoid-binding protein YceI
MTAGAQAAPRTIALAPPSTRVDVHAYGLGFLTIAGTFARFSGTLTYDPADRANCAVTLSVETASLTMDDAVRRAEMLSEPFLDAAAHPRIAFQGSCRGDAIQGMLDMRGVSRPLAFAARWSPGALRATADAVRAEWGIVAKPLLVGRVVRIIFATRLPAEP